MADESRKQLLADVKSFCNDTNFSDLTIKCVTDTYQVHKIVVASRSAVFAKALKFPGKEADESLIDLSENEPAIVKLLIQYLYEAEYEPTLLDSTPAVTDGVAAQITAHTCAKNPNNAHCQNNITYLGSAPIIRAEFLAPSTTYEMADKYDVSGLKELCIEKYKRACLVFWDDKKFAESAYHAYCTTPTRDKGLRNVVCKTISEHMNLLKKPEVEDLMTEFNGLAFGLLFNKAEQAGWCK